MPIRFPSRNLTRLAGPLDGHLAGRLAACAALAALLAAAALPAAAQPDFLVGARAGYADLSGSGLYDEVYDGGVTTLGLQAEARWPAFSLRLAAEQADADGDLFIPDVVGGGNVLPGSAVELSLDLYHLTAAYNGGGAGPWGWFAGGGVSFADAEEDGILGRRSNSATGFHAAGGVRRALGPRWELGGEILYYTISDLLEVEGLVTDDLEGIAGAATLSFAF